MTDDVLQNYGNALADLLTAYANQLTDGADDLATRALIERIGSGDEKIVIVSQLVPFSVAACHLDENGSVAGELFKITDGGLH